MDTIKNVTRREFCRSSATGLAGIVAAGAAPVFVPARVLGAEAPSKKLALGVIGCGRIANAYNVPSCLKNGGKELCEFIALSDVDLVRIQHLKRQLAGEKMQGRDLVADARCYQDYRRLLADPAVDGVLIAVPDHWHAQMAIEACRAGKDVFLQKPMAMTIGEGRAIVDAAKKYGRILRTGTQERTEENFIHAVECVREGRLGKVVRVEVGLPDDPKEYDLPAEEPVPTDFDWEGVRPAHGRTRAQRLRLEHVAGLCARGAVFAPPQPSARRGERRRQGEFRARRLDDDPGVRHGHDRQLGRAPPRFRATRPLRGVGRSRVGGGHVRVPEGTQAVGRAWRVRHHMDVRFGRGRQARLHAQVSLRRALHWREAWASPRASSPACRSPRTARG